MKYFFTVTSKEPSCADGRLRYEGPFDATAWREFGKRLTEINRLGRIYTVLKGEREVLETRDEAAARSKLIDLVQELECRRRDAVGVTFQVRNGDRSVTWSVRPFEERLCGGKPQGGV